LVDAGVAEWEEIRRAVASGLLIEWATGDGDRGIFRVLPGNGQKNGMGPSVPRII
jgi:hypothetical protein